MVCEELLFTKPKVTGIDAVSECIKKAKSEFPDLDLEVMDFTSLTYKDESFSAIVGYYYLGHIVSEERPILKESFKDI